MGGNKKGEVREWAVTTDHKQLIPNKYIMKWDEGMLKQCASVGAYYEEWVDHPKLRRVRMFDSDYIESASFTPWWIVPALYIPWSLLELDVSWQNFTSSNLSRSMVTNLVIDSCGIHPIFFSMFLYLVGCISWTLFEYFVHKHVFHWKPSNPQWNVLHFIGHGMHHLTPADKYRLVFPPAVSLPLGVVVKQLFSLLFPTGIRSAMYGGFLLGYALYESIHYLCHHAPYGSFLQERFKQHSAHHFNPRKQDKIFGVSTQIWDYAFDTM